MTPLQVYKKLFKAFGPQHWWPASSSFEVIVGAILTQNTSWNNVEKAIANLKKERMLSIKKIALVNEKKLALLIKSAGYFNQKACYLKQFCQHLMKHFNGNLKKFFNREIEEVRKELLSLKGIGNETADSILCYAGNKPAFVVDAYTLRFMKRFYGKNLSYLEAQEFFVSKLPNNTELFNEFHALLVELGKNYCKPKPLCRECPLNEECRFFN
jgi:endonuclease-3 related protein